MKQTTALTLLFGAAFVVRLLVLWVGRPEFVGWFNHTYYYYVQTNSLLNEGRLAFPDMPLIFYLYAITAKLLMLFQVEQKVAIVAASRFWMSLIPSLLVFPVFGILKNMVKRQDLPRWVWILSFCCAFYPLGILHMPEFLQKNMLGLLLLAILMQQSQALLTSFRASRMAATLVLLVLIIGTHFGSAAVALLYITALATSLFRHQNRTWTLRYASAAAMGLAGAIGFYSLTDMPRLQRIGHYIERIFDSSVLGSLITFTAVDPFTSVVMLCIPIGAAYFLYRQYAKAKPQLGASDSVFWLAQVIFCYLLVLPIYDPLLLARFVNFISLPLVFLTAYMLLYSAKKRWPRVLLMGLPLVITLIMATGDITSMFLHNRNKDAVHQDLRQMREAVDFGPNDLIITRNGAEHISNWFLDTKSCLITSFSTHDFAKYVRVYILNPVEGSMRIRDTEIEEERRYNYMLSNIPEPSEAVIRYDSEHMRLLELKAAPSAWQFDEKGNWTGYGH